MGRPRAIDERFQALADTLDRIIVSIDAAGDCEYANRRFYEHTGLPPHSALGNGYEAVLHPDDVAEFRASVAYAASESAAPPITMRLRDSQGTYADATVRWMPTHGPRGKLAGWVGAIDVVGATASVPMESTAMEHNGGAPIVETPLGPDLTDAGSNDFLAALSHALRSPLSAVLNWCQMLRAGHLDAEQTERALETIERNAKLEVRLIDDVLDVSRIVSGKITLQMRAVELASVVSAAVEEARPAAGGRTMLVDLADDSALVRAEATRLQQIVHHLLSNALKFTPAGGRIQVRTARTATHAQLIVSDTGSGILPDALPFIFDRFREADSSTARKHGGVGLALVRHLVEVHGGTVTAASAGPGQGTTVTVALPLAATENDAVQVVTPARSRRSAESARADLHGVRVVIVDDEPDVLELMRTILAHRGASVATAASASEAFDVLQQGRPDVLISDIAMPDADGYALLRKVRAPDTGERGMIPAIAVSGYTSAADRQRALAAGYQLHVGKPFDSDDLVAAVARLAGRL